VHEGSYEQLQALAVKAEIQTELAFLEPKINNLPDGLVSKFLSGEQLGELFGPSLKL